MTLSLADAVHRHYSVINIIIYHLLDIHTKSSFFHLENRITFFLTSYKVNFQIPGSANLEKLIPVIQRSFRSIQKSVSVAVNQFKSTHGINKLGYNKY